EHVTEVEILRPADRSKGNGILFFNVVNRGNKGGLSAFNAELPVSLPKTPPNAMKVAGDGFMMKHGYTIVWFGWQGDVLPENNRIGIRASCSFDLTVRMGRKPSARVRFSMLTIE